MNENRPAERLGLLVGTLLSPAVALSTRLRAARTFHPRGLVLEGQATPHEDAQGATRELAERLAGPVLARLSGALWKRHDSPDVLGCALRFRKLPGARLEQPEDQDLLFATIAAVPLLTISVLTTRARDFLGNYYYAVAPFYAPPVGPVRFRLKPLTRTAQGHSRAERLELALASAPIAFALEVRREESGSLYEPLCKIALTHELQVDQNALRFDPFRAGRDIQARGFLHNMRRAVYATGQRVRASHSA